MKPRFAVEALVRKAFKLFTNPIKFHNRSLTINVVSPRASPGHLPTSGLAGNFFVPCSARPSGAIPPRQDRGAQSGVWIPASAGMTALIKTTSLFRFTVLRHHLHRKRGQAIAPRDPYACPLFLHPPGNIISTRVPFPASLLTRMVPSCCVTIL